MAWESRDRGGFYYCRTRRRHGRQVREYVGGGRIGELAAALDAAEHERRRRQAQTMRREKEQAAERDAPLLRCCRAADLLVRAALENAGCHQHRGQWRRRRMGKPSEELQLLPGPAGWSDKKITDVYGRALRGDESVLPELGELLKVPGYVELFGGNLSRQAELALVLLMDGKRMGFREATLAQLRKLRQELAGQNPTPLERLLVERAVACWLEVQDATLRAVQGADDPVPWLAWRMKRQESTHRRFLSALRTLALVRKLALPTLVSQNVNVTVTPPASPAPQASAAESAPHRHGGAPARRPAAATAKAKVAPDRFEAN